MSNKLKKLFVVVSADHVLQNMLISTNKISKVDAVIL